MSMQSRPAPPKPLFDELADRVRTSFADVERGLFPQPAAPSSPPEPPAEGAWPADFDARLDHILSYPRKPRPRAKETDPELDEDGNGLADFVETPAPREPESPAPKPRKPGPAKPMAPVTVAAPRPFPLFPPKIDAAHLAAVLKVGPLLRQSILKALKAPPYNDRASTAYKALRRFAHRLETMLDGTLCWKG